MNAFNSALLILHSAMGNWLPDMDLNHDKQIQSLLCYRYTTRQPRSDARLSATMTKSSILAHARWLLAAVALAALTSGCLSLNPKSEATVTLAADPPKIVRLSALGFISDFGFRISDFR